MQIEDRLIGSILVVKPLDRRIDASSAGDFKGRMLDWIRQGNARILLDLSAVDFIDSSGLGAIISSLKAIGDGGDLVICGVRETVMSIFRLARMNRVFQILASEQEALQKMVQE
jgi:anti-sigma B factor antagonist